MCLNFVKFISVDSQDFIYNSYNSRFSVYADDVVRGDICTNDGTVIATTETSDGNEYRYYPFAELFSHVVGYVDEGMSGLESEYSFDLLKSHISVQDQFDNDLAGEKSKGDSLYTTLDYDVQLAASDGMGSYKGAVVAIEPSTGKIICMVSKPDFDPNSLTDYWDFITAEDNNSSVLLNRCVQGLYPPGSTFKIITTLAYLRQNPDTYEDFSYYCNGKLTIDDYTIHCYDGESHGSENLSSAFFNSCNTAFSTIGLSLDKDEYQNTAESLLFNTTLPTTISNVKNSSFSVSEDTADELLGQTAIGQGETTVTPLHMAMLASAIANDGVLMQSYIVDHIESADGYLVSENKPVEYGNIMTSEEASILSEYMSLVVTDGTAAKVDFGENYTVYGKTGTAEFTTDKDLVHSWFVGYAKDDDGNELAIAVIMEQAGTGSKYAAPLAAQVFDAYFN